MKFIVRVQGFRSFGITSWVHTVTNGSKLRLWNCSDSNTSCMITRAGGYNVRVLQGTKTITCYYYNGKYPCLFTNLKRDMKKSAQIPCSLLIWDVCHHIVFILLREKFGWYSCEYNVLGDYKQDFQLLCISGQ